MAHKTTEKSNENENENTINMEKDIKQQQNKLLSRKKLKAGKKNCKQKINSVQCLPSGSKTTNTQVNYTGAPLSFLPTPYVPTMATYYPQNYSQPFQIDWSPIMAAIQYPSPMYTLPLQPLPVLVNPVVTTICPYNCAVLSPQIITRVVAPPMVTELPTVTYPLEPNQVMYIDETNETTQVVEAYYEQQGENVVSYEEQIEESYANTTVDTSCNLQDTINEEITVPIGSSDPLEIYLSLPKNLFPAPRMLTVDPNPIIDEFCKLKEVHSHLSWMLDLEYGIPKFPIPRQIPVYNVNFNSIHCKNTPNAIHPGFDCCSEEFKRVFLFYYDCVVSSLYNGYVKVHCDASVDNFQEWILFPMQKLGMCWL